MALWGVDPATGQVQASYLSADNVYPGFTRSVQGFREPAVDTSNLFVDPTFTAGYAGAALQRALLPTVFCEASCEFLPGLYALDRVQIDGSRAQTAKR